MKAIDAAQQYYPCGEAREFMANMSITAAWNLCPHGSWMIWLLERLKPSNLGVWDTTEELKRAKRALRDRSSGAIPADRIRSAVTARQILTLVRGRTTVS